MRSRPIRLRHPDGSVVQLRPQTRRQMLDAIRLMDKFHWERGATQVTPIKEDLTPPPVVAGLGRAVAIVYESDKDGELVQYIHQFNSRSRPWLAASPDGKRLFLLGYRGRVRSSGITG